MNPSSMCEMREWSWTTPSGVAYTEHRLTVVDFIHALVAELGGYDLIRCGTYVHGQLLALPQSQPIAGVPVGDAFDLVCAGEPSVTYRVTCDRGLNPHRFAVELGRRSLVVTTTGRCGRL